MTSQSTRPAKHTRLLEALEHLPYRDTFGAPRPRELAGLALPPAPMPGHIGGRPLKAWRYVAAFSPELMACMGLVRLGPLRQSFWAVWDRRGGRLYERTRPGAGGVRLDTGRASVRDGDIALELEFGEGGGVESVCRSGALYAWTRKQAGIPAHVRLALAGQVDAFPAVLVIDDSSGYHARHTQWRWSAGVGRARDGRPVAWNLVDGINDPPHASERSVWIDGVAIEVPPVDFADDLTSVAGLRFVSEAERVHTENRVLVRSRYRQPFGTFSGVLPGEPAVDLAEGLGVMEAHDVFW